MRSYDDTYFAYFEPGVVRSAAAVVPIVRTWLDVGSVVDFGCGSGAWLAAWRDAGVEDVLGVDGPYVRSQVLRIPVDRFTAADLALPVRLGRRFDLAECLEVGEHLPLAAAPILVETLVSHAPTVLFSAATPGQGGECHVNEQPLAFWRTLFARHGYVPADLLRPRLKGMAQVEPWYRYNTLLYVDAREIDTFPAVIREAVIDDDIPIADYAPPLTRLRQQLVRRLPRALVTGAAIVATRWHRFTRGAP